MANLYDLFFLRSNSVEPIWFRSKLYSPTLITQLGDCMVFPVSAQRERETTVTESPTDRRVRNDGWAE